MKSTSVSGRVFFKIDDKDIKSMCLNIMNSDNNRLVHGETFATTRFLQNLVDFLAHKKSWSAYIV